MWPRFSPEHRISGLPVISEQRRVLGIVSEADILIKERGPEARHGGLIAWLLVGGLPDDERLSARTSGEAMTSPAITIGAEREHLRAHRAEGPALDHAKPRVSMTIRRVPSFSASSRIAVAASPLRSTSGHDAVLGERLARFCEPPLGLLVVHGQHHRCRAADLWQALHH